MKKYHLGLFLLTCLVLSCSELHRMEVRNPSRSKPSELHRMEVRNPSRSKPKAETSNTYSRTSSTNSKAGKLPVFPVSDHSSKNIISYFGDERAGGARKHEGIDIGAPRGTAVLSVCTGVVTRVVEKGNGGKQVWVRNLDSTKTFYYAHLDKQLVTEGQRVKEGDILGTVGNTGNASKGPPHLHFEVMDQSGKAMDPLPFMPI